MNTNEETKYMDPVDDSQEIVEENVENSKKETWKAVSIGGVSGILMGAGAVYAIDALADSGEVQKASVPGTVRTNDTTGIKVATVSDDMSFGEAFATARHAVGSGGVFHWRGNVYNTFTKEEWNAMTPAERNAFAREAQPEITAEANLHPHHASDQNHVADNHHHDNSGGKKAQDHEEIAKGGGKGTDDDDIKVVTDDDNHHASNSGDDDIHVVGTDEIDGHAVAFIDTTGNGEADVAVIDVDNDNKLTDADLIVDNEGNAMTLGGEVVSTAETGYTQDDNYDLGADSSMDFTTV